MLIDTHCHINMMIKKGFDIPLDSSAIPHAQKIITEAQEVGVTTIVNVGTSIIESKNCVTLAKQFKNNFAVIGIHPNDATSEWPNELTIMAQWLREKKNKIVGIGECGIDLHYPDYNLQRQSEAFKAQIELALENDIALVVHSRDAYEETLRILEEYKNDITRGIMHCFSYDTAFAHTVIEWGFALGIGGTVTYPKNNELRTIVTTTDLQHIVLETDAPFLPPQIIRGKQNHPKYIRTIAEFIAELRGESLEVVADGTTQTAKRIFNLQLY